MPKELLAGISSIIVGLITFVGVVLTIRRNIYAQTVSNSRNQWITVFRDNISIMLAEGESYFFCESKEKNECYKKFCQARNMVVSRFNDTEPEHILLETCIRQLDLSKIKLSKFMKLKDIILLETRYLLKDEWERVKGEAYGRQ